MTTPAVAQFVDDCASAPVVQEGVFTFDLTSATGGDNPFTVPCAQDRLALIDQWVMYVPTASGPVSMSTLGLSDGDTVLSVHDVFSNEFDCFFAPFQVRACNDDSGGPQSRLVLVATAGEPMLVRISGALESRPTGSVRIEAFEPIAGDVCATAVAAVDGVNVYDVGDAAVNQFEACFGLRDVWFSYVPAVRGALTVSACGQPTAASISIFGGCGGPVLACSSYEGCIAGAGVEAGVPVLIRIANDSATGPEQFTITLDPGGIPLNDNCASPQPVALGETTFDNTYATSEFEISCATGEPFPFASGLDLWYVFTPEETGTYDISTELSIGISDTTLAVYSACFDLPLACDEDSRGFLSFIRAPLAAGQGYLIQVSGAGLPNAGSPIDRGPGILSIRRSIAPSNDDCEGALDVLPGLIAYDLYDATTGPQVPSCVPVGRITTSDVWFRYVPTESAPVEFQLLPGGAAGSLSVFTSCGDSAPLTAGFSYDVQTGLDAARIVIDGEVGSPLLIRLAYLNFEGEPLLPSGAGELYVGPPTTAVPPNDRCEDALLLATGPTPIDLTGSIKACVVNDAPDYDPCVNVTDNNAYYRFTAAATEPVTILINDGVPYPEFAGLLVSVYTACGGGQPIVCSFPLGDAPADSVQFDAVEGVEYIVRVGSLLRYGSVPVLTGEIVVQGSSSCAADWNGDDAVNSNDISTFITSWLSSVQIGDLIADFNGDMAVNSGDISAFLTAWLDAVNNGC